MNKLSFCVLIVTVSAACNAGVSDNERVSKYIKLANIKVKESYSVVLENGPKENDRQLEGESKDSKNKIHIFETRKATYLDSATYFLDSALSISSNRADVWIGKTQIEFSAADGGKLKIGKSCNVILNNEYRMYEKIVSGVQFEDGKYPLTIALCSRLNSKLNDSEYLGANFHFCDD